MKTKVDIPISLGLIRNITVLPSKMLLVLKKTVRILQKIEWICLIPPLVDMPDSSHHEEVGDIWKELYYLH